MCCNQTCSVELYNDTTVIFKVYSDITHNLNRPIISLLLSDNLFSITAGDPGRLRHRDCWQATIISAMSLKVTSSGTSVCNDGKSHRGWPEQSGWEMNCPRISTQSWLLLWRIRCVMALTAVSYSRPAWTKWKWNFQFVPFSGENVKMSFGFPRVVV